MKFLTKFIVIITLLYFVSNFSLKSHTKIKAKAKSRSKARSKSKINKSLINMKNSKKNGPLSWDLLSDEKVIEKFIHDNTILDKPSIQTKPIQIPTPPQIYYNVPLSENQKSITFRTVGPNVDSTVNNKGIKYSSIINNKKGKIINPGFYGKSRLTR